MFAHKYFQKSISSIYFTAIFRNQTVIDVHLKLYQPLLSEKEWASDDDRGWWWRENLFGTWRFNKGMCESVKIDKFLFSERKSQEASREVEKTHTSGNNLFRENYFYCSWKETMRDDNWYTLQLFAVFVFLFDIAFINEKHEMIFCFYVFLEKFISNSWKAFGVKKIIYGWF